MGRYIPHSYQAYCRDRILDTSHIGNKEDIREVI